LNFILHFIKGLFITLNFLLFLVIIAYIAARYQKKKLAFILQLSALLFFLLVSTSYLPQFLARNLEQQFSPLQPISLKNKFGKKYIHLLGAGYGLDKRLPPTAQLATVSQGRLIEAVRIWRQMDSSILVCSGGYISDSALYENQTQARVARKAAILLGVDSNRIITLNDPTTTKEEAVSLAKQLDTSITLILVTDALHMPRAMNIFSKQGFYPIAAPTNYKVLQTPDESGFKWWPSVGNIILMDMVLHEYMGNLKNLLQ